MKLTKEQLKEEDVISIYEMRKNGMKLKDISKCKNTSVSNLMNILKGKSWKHVFKNQL